MPHDRAMTPHTITSLGTILGVWAHPDDESYLSAGLMAMASVAGQRVVVVHATLGEHGAPDPVTMPPHQLRAIRRGELARALAVVGVDEHHQLDHPDGGCQESDPNLAIESIERIIDKVTPDTIVTFGPDGMTGHPDHRAVSAWTTHAWRRSGRRARLLYAAVTTDWADEHRALNDRLGAFPSGWPLAVAPDAVALQVVLSETVLDTKLAALAAHRSQTIPLVEAAGVDAYRNWWSTETFVEQTT
jgi:LmbE family N-acetylglucosaminyl deacetylase